MSPAISIRNLGKRYRVNHAQERASYRTLRDSLSRAATAPLRRLRGETNGTSEDFWALKDVSFDIQPGEVVGIIGRNGAGKSTLLKILSRITKPTTGEVEINGRVGSLLEVGTGFHPELTGRENIFMNGSILGMSRSEVSLRFDEIVCFSGVEKFLDTPVKRYSSGMHVRLAFAVAAHLEPEVLIVDEVLAVGDDGFQKKCLRRIGDLAQSGRTVLFVTHNMAAVENLCDRAVLLSGGEMTYAGSPANAIMEYLHDFDDSCDGANVVSAYRSPPLRSVIQRLEFVDPTGRSYHVVPVGAPLSIRIQYKNDARLIDPYFGVTIENATGTNVAWLNTRLQRGRFPDLPPEGSVMCHLARLPLTPGAYYVSVGCGCGIEQVDYVRRAARLDIGEADFFGTGRLPQPSQAIVLLDADWTAAS